MKVPLTWLQEYVDFPTVEELGNKLTAIGYMQDGPVKDIEGERVLDLEVRQNRSDGLSIIGVAREVAAAFSTKMKEPKSNYEIPSNLKENLKIEIDPQLCFRFTAVKMANVSTKESPDWLKHRLTLYGIKTINAIVDITNYVMVEYGQPLHAFDAEYLTGSEVFIRAAKNNEEISVLNKRTINLTTDDIVLADSKKALAIVPIGGIDSGVSEKTKTILLETAIYNQASVRRTSLRHNIRTEASTRLEKFLHPDQTQVALLRTIELINEIVGGEVVAYADVYPQKIVPSEIIVKKKRISRIAGYEILMEEAVEILNRLTFEVIEHNDDFLRVVAPSFRTDIEQEDDVIEEILRIKGYEFIPEQMPSLPTPVSLQSKGYTLEEKIRDLMVACGYDEQITEPLVDEKEPLLEPVRLQNSLTSEKTMLRTSLKNSLVMGLKNRKRYYLNQVFLFEVGKIYYQKEHIATETRVVGIIINSQKSPYTHLKGTIELIINRLGYDYNLTEIILERIDKDTYWAQINLDSLLRQKAELKFQVVVTPPQVIFQHYSFLVASEVRVGEIIDYIRKIDQLVSKVILGEEPRNVSNDKKSVFLKVTFSVFGNSISQDQVDPVHQKIIDHLKSKFSAEFER